MVQILSIQVGKVQTHTLPDGEQWTTAYHKAPVDGAIHLGLLGLTGDEQHHKKFHGGIYRAILGYSAEHYPLWQEEFEVALPYGAFGENFTISGHNEDTVCIGDVYAVGDTVRLKVTQPRRPCNQIDQWLQRDGLRAHTAKTLRTGWYMRVLVEGTVQAGMPIVRLENPYPQWTIRKAHQAYDNRAKDPETAMRLSACEALEPEWRRILASH